MTGKTPTSHLTPRSEDSTANPPDRTPEERWSGHPEPEVKSAQAILDSELEPETIIVTVKHAKPSVKGVGTTDVRFEYENTAPGEEGESRWVLQTTPKPTWANYAPIFTAVRWLDSRDGHTVKSVKEVIMSEIGSLERSYAEMMDVLSEDG